MTCTLGCGLLYWLRTFYCPGFICCVQAVRQFQNPNTHPKELKNTANDVRSGAASALAGQETKHAQEGRGAGSGAKGGASPLEQFGMSVLPHLEEPQKAVGQIINVPGYFWSGGTEKERP